MSSHVPPNHPTHSPPLIFTYLISSLSLWLAKLLISPLLLLFFFSFFIFLWDNYTLLTCGLHLILCVHPWFKFWHFTYLWFSQLSNHNPPLQFPLLKHKKGKKQNSTRIKTHSLPKPTHSHPTQQRSYTMQCNASMCQVLLQTT